MVYKLEIVPLKCTVGHLKLFDKSGWTILSVSKGDKMTKFDVSVLCLLFRFVQTPDYEICHCARKSTLVVYEQQKCKPTSASAPFWFGGWLV